MILISEPRPRSHLHLYKAVYLIPESDLPVTPQSVKAKDHYWYTAESHPIP
jgi:hypothetical protein